MHNVFCSKEGRIVKEFGECYIKPDLLLIYLIEDNTLILVDIDLHSEDWLFNGIIYSTFKILFNKKKVSK
ncbi:type II toxin-antitoxin system YafQ family toxin [Sulfurimonas sp.]|uniref:type II toxin-antitoxin system YafQ family toxin n=1 Tax=Sulfurimonas sp. TaxID=2022749 RepID=UPI0039E56B63